MQITYRGVCVCVCACLWCFRSVFTFLEFVGFWYNVLMNVGLAESDKCQINESEPTSPANDTCSSDDGSLQEQGAPLCGH